MITEGGLGPSAKHAMGPPEESLDASTGERDASVAEKKILDDMIAYVKNVLTKFGVQIPDTTTYEPAGSVHYDFYTMPDCHWTRYQASVLDRSKKSPNLTEEAEQAIAVTPTNVAGDSLPTDSRDGESKKPKKELITLSAEEEQRILDEVVRGLSMMKGYLEHLSKPATDSEVTKLTLGKRATSGSSSDDR